MIKSNKINQYLSEILYLLGHSKKEVPKLLIFFLAASIFDLAGLGLIGPYIAIITSPDSLSVFKESVNIPFLTSKTSSEIIIIFSVVLLIIFALKAAVSIWINYTIVRFSADRQVELRCRLMKVYQSLPYTEFIQRNSSEYIHNTQTLVTQYSTAILTGGMRALSDLTVTGVLLAFLAMSNFASFSILILLLAVFGISYDLAFRRKIRYLGSRSNLAADKMVKGISEGIAGLKEVRILGKEHYFYDQVSQNAEKYGQYHARSITLSTVPRYLFETILISFIISLVLVSLFKGDELQDLLPVLGLFGLAAVRLLPAASVISVALVQFRFNRDAVQRLWLDLSRHEDKCQVEEAKVTQKVDAFTHLEVNKVTYSYASTTIRSLDEMSLHISNGEAIGIIGPSGSGKTTLVDVLLGLMNPDSGYIKFNNKDYIGNIEEWRSHIAYLPQEIFIIDSSLRENIALGIDVSEIDEIKLRNAINMSSLTDLVNQLPEGVDTILGQGGVRFSGGQRQRVALARAFYHERDVIIMDESTSALDSETERQIVKEIQNLKGNKTSIIIAHRLTTVKHCDRIYRLNKGMIVESGTPRDVLPELF